jgi:hypothetical protein
MMDQDSWVLKKHAIFITPLAGWISFFGRIWSKLVLIQS